MGICRIEKPQLITTPLTTQSHTAMKRIEHKNITSAKAIATAFGAVTFKGTTENCQVMRFYDNLGEAMGHIYASYNSRYERVFIVRYSA
jgi:hypothetical protein